MANKDVRDWIDGIMAAGELKIITGAEPKEEIGGIVDIYMRRMGNPAVMFDEIPGFPKGYRVIANILTSIPRVNLALGLPPQSSEMEQIQWWRNYFKSAPFKPTFADTAGRESSKLQDAFLTSTSALGARYRTTRVPVTFMADPKESPCFNSTHSGFSRPT